ncbi:MAG: clostripain-related cysteine peptidase [Rikenellaceae bacterium]
MLKRYLYIILLSFWLIVSCSKEGDDSPYSGPKSQVTLFYFMGTDLSYYYGRNISAIESAVKAGALGDEGALYILKPSSSGTASLYELSESGGVCESREVCEYSDFDSLSTDGFATVISDMKAEAVSAAKGGEYKFNLVVGSHGMGWLLSDGTTLSKAYSFSEHHHPGVANQHTPTRYLGVSKDGYMDIADFVEAIEGGDTHFDYILFDACLMSSIEALYRMRGCADYIVASPCEILATGFPYDSLLQYLFTEDGAEYDLQSVCEGFYNYYETTEGRSGCVAMCVTSELEALFESVKALELKTLTTAERYALQSYDGYSSHIFYDLGNYIEVAASDNEAGIEVFWAQFDLAFPAECRLTTDMFYTWNGGNKSVDFYSGVSTSAPSLNSSCGGWSSEPWALASDFEQ